MDVIILLVGCLISFIFIMYVPTVLFYNSETQSKEKEDSLALFFGASLLFLVFDYLCVLFFNMKAIPKLVECSSGLLNFDCILGKFLPRLIRPSMPIFTIFFMQLVAIILYAFVTARFIIKAKKERKVLLIIFIYFLVSGLFTGLHYVYLNDTLFDGWGAMVSFVGTNGYFFIPFIYLIIMILFNKDKLIIRKRK